MYFLYRYYVMVREETPYYFGAVPCCVLSTQLILQLCEKPSDLYEVARMYSAEIEYSDENVEELIKSLDEYNGGEGE